MKKNILILLISLFIIIGIVIFATLAINSTERNNITEEDLDPDPEDSTSIDSEPEDEVTEELIQCLKEAEVVIYGTQFCPACMTIREKFGGDEMISPIYVDCDQRGNVCSQEKETRYVPEIQIKGELYEESMDPFDIAKEVNCEL